jgi:hypothetical protein
MEQKNLIAEHINPQGSEEKQILLRLRQKVLG